MIGCIVLCSYSINLPTVSYPAVIVLNCLLRPIQGWRSRMRLGQNRHFMACCGGKGKVTVNWWRNCSKNGYRVGWSTAGSCGSTSVYAVSVYLETGGFEERAFYIHAAHNRNNQSLPQLSSSIRIWAASSLKVPSSTQWKRFSIDQGWA